MTRIALLNESRSPDRVAARSRKFDFLRELRIIALAPNIGRTSDRQDIRTLEDAGQGGLTRFSQFLQAVAPPMIILSVFRDIFIGKPYRSIYIDPLARVLRLLQPSDRRKGRGSERLPLNRGRVRSQAEEVLSSDDCT